MEQLTKIERIRLSPTDVQKLNDLKKIGIHKSSFIRQAVREKFERDLPKEKRVFDCPF